MRIFFSLNFYFVVLFICFDLDEILCVYVFDNKMGKKFECLDFWRGSLNKLNWLTSQSGWKESVARYHFHAIGSHNFFFSKRNLYIFVYIDVLMLSLSVICTAMRSPIIIIQMQEIVVIYVFAKVGGIAVLL